MFAEPLPNDWRRLEALLDQVLDAAPERRREVLDALGRDDPAMREELDRLLHECERQYPLLDRPVAERFAGLFGGEMPRIPTIIADRYQIVRELGRGGMAVVYLARDVRHDRDVAVKVVRPELAATLGRARFLREIAIAAKLKHPHIVPLFDSGEVDGLLYYVMPYQEEQSLRARLQRDGTLPVDDVVAILGDVCDALAYAHGQGVVHRDIKPDNILLSGRHALVTDFGVARAVSAATEQDALTTAGGVVGTAAYMAPEQHTENAPVDHRADIYAIGVTAYEMLSGVRPFAGETPPSQRAGSTGNAAAGLTPSPNHVPPAIAAVVMKCLSPDPAARFQTADEIVAALAGTSPARRPLADSRRRRVIAVRTVAALVLFAVAAWQIPRFRDAAPAPPVRALALGILPTTDASPNAQLDWLARGLTKQLSIELVSVAGLEMRPSETIATELARGIRPDSIALLHNVDYFVSLTLSRATDDSVTVSLELIEGGLRPVRGGYVQEPLIIANPVVVLGQRVAERLRPMLGTRIRERQLEASPTNPRALELRRLADNHRLRARARIVAGDLLGAQWALDSAEALLVASERLDRNWPVPRVSRAALSELNVFLRLAKSGGADTAGVRAAFDAGIAIVDTLLHRTRSNAAALALRGRLRWERIAAAGLNPLTVREQADTARRDLEQALVIDSLLPRAAADLSRIMYHAHANYRDAVEYAERAYRLDSFLQDAGTVLNLLALSKFELNDDAAAARLCSEGRRRFPNDPSHYECALQLMAAGNVQPDPDSAWAYLASVNRSGGASAIGRARTLATVAAILARTSRADSARAVLQRARALAGNDSGVSPATRVRFLAAEASALFRLGDIGLAHRRLSEMRAIDSVTAQVLEQRRSLKDVITPSLGRPPATLPNETTPEDGTIRHH